MAEGRAIDTTPAPVITATSYGSDLNRPGYVDEGYITGIREDLEDVVYDISPTDTPFLTKCAKLKATNTYHEWQTNELADAEINAHIEGADTGAEFNQTVRVGNYTQILKKGVRLSGTSAALNLAGRQKEMAFQVLQKTKEIKRDLEVSLLGTQARDPGSSSQPRIMAGVGCWMSTNTIGDATFPTTNDGNGTFTAGAGATLSQDDFDDLLEQIWTAGGEPDRVYLRADLMSAALSFVGNNNQRATIVAKEDMVINNMVKYETPWGLLTFVPDRFMPEGSVYILDSSMWKVASLRGFKNEKLAKTGDSNHTQIVTEQTLVACNEASSGHMATYTD